MRAVHKRPRSGRISNVRHNSERPLLPRGGRERPSLPSRQILRRCVHNCWVFGLRGRHDQQPRFVVLRGVREWHEEQRQPYCVRGLSDGHLQWNKVEFLHLVRERHVQRRGQAGQLQILRQVWREKFFRELFGLSAVFQALLHLQQGRFPNFAEFLLSSPRSRVPALRGRYLGLRSFQGGADMQ